MKELINELNQRMLAEGDIWQITSIKGPKMVSMPAEKLAEMIEYLVLNKELQDRIEDEYLDIEREQSLLDEADRLEGTPGCCAMYYDGAYRTEAYMNAYKEFKSEIFKDLEDDEDIPF